MTGTSPLSDLLKDIPPNPLTPDRIREAQQAIRTLNKGLNGGLRFRCDDSGEGILWVRPA